MIIPNHAEIWDENLMMINCLQNRMYSTSGNFYKKTPHEVFTCKKSDLSMLLVFGEK